jgi:hypothetical protein
MMVFEHAISDYHSIDRFFLNTTAMDFVRAFFALPLATIKLAFNDLLAVFHQNLVARPRIDLIIIAFLGFSLTGIYAKQNRLLYLAVLIPIIWGLVETRPWRWFA